MASEKDLEKWWVDLGNSDATIAYAASWQLQDTGAESVIALARKHLHPATAPDPAVLAKWIKKLDDSEYAVREQASRELESQGSLVFPALRKLLASEASAEAKHRASALLKKFHALNSADLRGIRAVQLLRRLNSDDLRRFLNDLSQGAAEHPVTRAARRAIGQPDH